MENNIRVLLAPAASCRAARLRLLSVSAVPFQGTSVPAAGWSTEGVVRVQTPLRAMAQGTGVSTDRLGEGLNQGYGQRPAFIPTQPTVRTYDRNVNRNFSTKHTVVVDDIPGVRTWSPPV